MIIEMILLIYTTGKLVFYHNQSSGVKKLNLLIKLSVNKSWIIRNQYSEVWEIFVQRITMNFTNNEIRPSTGEQNSPEHFRYYCK